jgi:dienelactone hydrolase
MNRHVSVPSPTEIPIPLPDAELEGAITLPPTPQGIVVFAHGSGSSRHSPRNKYVAEVLQEAGLGTLLMDLLTREEEIIDQRTRHLRFDIELLSGRLTGVLDWMTRNATTQHIPVGLFGASTGAAAALRAAAGRPRLVQAVVSRGGRPDLAGVEALRAVEAPTLLIVGGDDAQVIPLNTYALDQMHAPRDLAIVSGATHLFEEPGTLAAAAGLARDWFLRYLGDDTLRPQADVEEFPA